MSTRKPPRTLFVLWYDPKGRAILPVGRLDHGGEVEGGGFTFRYVAGARAAERAGFLPFLAFPELYQTYQSDELFPFFANRAMPTTRPDYLEYLNVLGLDADQTDAVDVLSRSGGRRETDRIEIVPRPERSPTGGYTTHFLLRGLRYFPLAEERITRLVAGEQLLWMLDGQNDYNRDAIALRTGDRYLLGYLPDYLVADIAELVKRRVNVSVAIERINLPPAPRHHRLLCRLEAAWPDDFEPLDGASFQPIWAD